jgi:thioredoxin-dependent peroxiredoxin
LQGVRDHRADYEAAGARVLGVSPDTVEAISAFAGKHGLDFRLLADTDHEVADACGRGARRVRTARPTWA